MTTYYASKPIKKIVCRYCLKQINTSYWKIDQDYLHDSCLPSFLNNLKGN